MISPELIKDIHKKLTQGTYDERRIRRETVHKASSDLHPTGTSYGRGTTGICTADAGTSLRFNAVLPPEADIQDYAANPEKS